ncbi:MAG TPA: hypothetical protein VFL56_05590, partial [Solirubrobacterales bacterium]|nr:hypothetical protein [Solirubrobacterales bacterium]
MGDPAALELSLDLGEQLQRPAPCRVRVDQDQMGAIRADRVTLCGQAGDEVRALRRRARLDRLQT